MKKTLGIYGFGGLGKEVMDIALRIDNYSDIIIIDDFKKNANGIIKSYNFDEFKDIFSTQHAEIIIAQGEPIYRATLKDKIKSEGFKLATIIDPSSIISPKAKIEEGVIICAFCIVAYEAIIKTNCLINVGSIIGHNVEIGSNSVVSSSVNIGGSSKIGENCFLGMSSVIKEKITIGNKSILSMASVLYKNLPDNIIAVGNPARPSRNNESNLIFK